ncbi:MAG: fimbrillin family protein [Bacteroidales bacterium]|nr:fimbrillin family protein [Bacteroidales bacterium]
MKKRNIYILTAAALMVLASCNKEDGPQGSGPISIDATVGSATKVSSTGFAKNDQIAVYAWTGNAATVPAKPAVNGIVNTFDGTKWVPAAMMEWENSKDAHYFLGICPVPASVSSFTEDSFVLNPDNQGASDLLVATSLDGITPSGDPVELEFHHVMAKLNINLKFRTEFESTPTVTSVTAKAKGSATVNYLTKTVTATGNATSITLQPLSDAATGYELSYSGIQVPQTGVRTITVTIDGKKYEYNANDDIPLQSGKYTTLGLMVGKDKQVIELETVTVDDWADGAQFGGSLADRLIDGHVYVDMGNGLMWATCNIGAENNWEYGDYFAWAETETYYLPGRAQENPTTHWRPGKSAGYCWASYKYCKEDPNVTFVPEIAGWGLTKYCTLRQVGYNGFTDDKIDLEPEDDAATVLWGKSWRTPTSTELSQLVKNENYSHEWVDNYGGKNVKGLLVTCKSGPCKGNSIFLPAAGYRSGQGFAEDGVGVYWSKSGSGTDYDCWAMIYSKNRSRQYLYNRYEGLSIRPVSEIKK